MKKEKKILDIWRERIKEEALQGDKVAACNEAGVSTTTLRTAILRDSLADLKDKELKVLQVLMLRLDERKRQHEEIIAQYAG